MKWMISRHAGRWLACVVCLCIGAFVLLSIIGYWGGWGYVSVFAAMEQKNDAEIKNGLLLQTVHRLGVATPQEAAVLWADGVSERNGAMQYAAMIQPLRETYAAALSQTEPNWVTGVSSPWVDSYRMEWTNGAAGHPAVCITFLYVTSSGPMQEWQAELSLEQEGEYWRIASLQMDEDLLPFTGFQSMDQLAPKTQSSDSEP